MNNTFGKTTHSCLLTVCLLLVFIFLSCENPDEKEDNNNIKKTIEKTEGEKVADYESEKKDFMLLMAKEQYRFSRYGNCKPVGKNSEEEKYRHNTLFNVSNQTIGDSLYVKFNFVSYCCLEHIGYAKRHNDTLKLTYKNIAIDACKCFCTYQYEFALPRKLYPNKCILLEDSLLYYSPLSNK